MKLLDALKNVKKDFADSAEPQVFLAQFGMDFANIDYEQFDMNVKAYWVLKTLCTDTWVGLQAIYLKGELVAYTYQQYRKSNVHVKFIDINAKNKMGEFIKSISEYEEYGDVDDLSEDEIDDYYSVQYTSQLLQHDGYYNGKPAKYIMDAQPERNYISEFIFVQVEGEKDTIKIPTKDFKMKINVEGL